MIGEMVRRFGIVLQDEKGIETLEWIAIACLIIILVAMVAYPGGVPNAINAMVNNITNHV